MPHTVPSMPADGPDFTLPAVQAHYIEQAADHIDRFGKHMGGYWPLTRDDDGVWFDEGYDHGMPCCTVGALAVALGVHEPMRVDDELIGMRPGADELTPHPVLAALMHALCATEVEQVFSWSDSARDDQVVARLRYVAAQLREAAIPAQVA